ncbi:unnamed protein product [Fraxinus pennsylvanica]|uniref:Uncharacterized protein n=1 Tax=Fraxinus pennsylvanica TaxID=56036 RepID=A0AAD2ECP6_9LAMI|nr:unnamed protein product [Fraxinus pennsylvanica]
MSREKSLNLLPMVDSFGRAKQQIILETEKEKKIDESYQGMYKQFVEIMRSFLVAAVPTHGCTKILLVRSCKCSRREVEHKNFAGVPSWRPPIKTCNGQGSLEKNSALAFEHS